jgi:hypothetical protein
MRVQATKQGFYDQCLREPGEVFDLVDEPDGSMPIRMNREYEMDAKTGKPTGEYTETPYLDKDGNVMHRDFAPDAEQITGRGHFRGETFAPGWMVQVPDETLVGIYPPETTFQSTGRETAKPIQRIIKPSDEPMNAPRATPMRGNKTERVRRAG